MIEIGCVVMQGWQVTSERLPRNFNPGAGDRSRAVAIHGLTDEFRRISLLRDVAGEFVESLCGTRN
ncbi:MAG: hypothetical protein IPH08_03495 [Rhodocyclaceae bacterium]|nr:hypothetical protein [Rhodocyclaceae bacterium]